MLHPPVKLLITSYHHLTGFPLFCKDHFPGFFKDIFRDDPAGMAGRVLNNPAIASYLQNQAKYALGSSSLNVWDTIQHSVVSLLQCCVGGCCRHLFINVMRANSFTGRDSHALTCTHIHPGYQNNEQRSSNYHTNRGSVASSLLRTPLLHYICA